MNVRDASANKWNKINIYHKFSSISQNWILLMAYKVSVYYGMNSLLAITE
jgi:hypothetical protein